MQTAAMPLMWRGKDGGLLMAGLRSELELEAVARRLAEKLHDEDAKRMEGWHEEVRTSLRKQDEDAAKQYAVLDTLRDGAQAALLTATILHGNPEFGIKGALPDIQERLSGLESKVSLIQNTGDTRHEANTERLDVLEQNQHRLRRTTSSIWKFLVKDKDGVSYTRAMLTSAVTGGGGYLVAHFGWIKRLFGWIHGGK